MSEEEGMLERPKQAEKTVEQPVAPVVDEEIADALLEEIAKIDAGKVETQKSKPKEIPADKPVWCSQADLEIAKRAGQKQEKEKTAEKQKTKSPGLRAPGGHFAEIDAGQKTKLKSGDVTPEVNRQWQEMAEKGLMMPCELDHERFAEAVKVEQRTKDFEEKEAELELIRDLTDKMSADAGMTLEKKSVADAIFKAEVDKEEKAERDLPDKRTVRTDISTTSCPEGLSIPLSREEAQEAFRRAEIRQKMEELRTQGRIEDLLVQKTQERIKEEQYKQNRSGEKQTEYSGTTAQRAADAEKVRDKKVEMQMHKYEAATAEKPINRTFEQMQGLSDGTYAEPRLDITADAILQTNDTAKIDLAEFLADVNSVVGKTVCGIKIDKIFYPDVDFDVTTYVGINADGKRVSLHTEQILQELREKTEQRSTTKDNPESAEKTLEAIAEQESAKQKEEAKKPIEKEEEKLEQDERCGRTVTGQYKIVGKIGNGACGILYKATAEITEKPVILKVSSNKDVGEGNDQIIAEATVHKFLHHPNIISIDSVVKDEENRLYAVMQEIKGAKKLDVAEKRSLKEIVRIIKSAAETFDYAHKEGVLHRDIKPDNILIDSEGKPYVIDFGAAQVTDKEMIERLRNSLGETSFTDGKAGTPKYMAPEIIESDAEPSPKTDVYSLGKVLYHMLMQTDKATPIGDVEKQVTVNMKKTGKIVDVVNSIQDAHDAKSAKKLSEIVAKAVSDADNRYKTMSEFAKDLETVINDLPDKITKPVEVVKQEQKPNPNEFFISEDKDYFHLHNVNLDGKICDYSWTKQLLNEGKPATPDVHVKNTKDKKEKLASLPVYNASITAVVKHKKNSAGKQKELADKVAQMFANDFNDRNVLTSTRVVKEGEQHRVTHDFDYDTAESTVTKLGRGQIKANSGLEETAQALFKTKNCAQIEQTFEDLTGRKPCVWISKCDELAGVFSLDLNQFNIYCIPTGNQGFARGVVVKQKNLEETIDDAGKPAVRNKNREYTALKLSAYKGLGLMVGDKWRKAAEYLTYVNNILTSFGTSLKLLQKSKIKIWRPIPFGKERLEIEKLRDVVHGYKGYYYESDEKSKEYLRAVFVSENGAIGGYIAVRDDFTGVELVVTPNHPIITEHERLLQAIDYFIKIKVTDSIAHREVLWGSPKKKLEKAGFTLDYAIDLFDNNRFRSPEVMFEEGKPLYTVDGKRIGYAFDDRSINPNHSRVFRSGLPLRREYHDFKTEQLIDLGDRYLLKPQ